MSRTNVIAYPLMLRPIYHLLVGFERDRPPTPVTLSTATPLSGAHLWNDKGYRKPVILSERVRRV